MIRNLIVAGALVAAMTAPAFADPIEGTWKTQAGDNALITSCSNAFCIKLTSGEYSGKSIGKMKAAGGGNYVGSITKPSNGKTYSGSGRLSGSKLKMTGCVLKILCESQTWTKM